MKSCDRFLLQRPECRAWREEISLIEPDCRHIPGLQRQQLPFRSKKDCYRYPGWGGLLPRSGISIARKGPSLRPKSINLEVRVRTPTFSIWTNSGSKPLTPKIPESFDPRCEGAQGARELKVRGSLRVHGWDFFSMPILLCGRYSIPMSLR